MTHCGSEALTKYKRMFGSGRMAQCGSSHIGEVEGEIHQDRVIACSILVMIKNGGTGNAMKNTILCAAKVYVQVKRSISVLSQYSRPSRLKHRTISERAVPP